MLLLWLTVKALYEGYSYIFKNKKLKLKNKKQKNKNKKLYTKAEEIKWLTFKRWVD